RGANDATFDAIIPRLLAELAATTDDTLVGGIRKAVDQKLIPASLAARAPAIVRLLHRRAQAAYDIQVRLVESDSGAPLAGLTVQSFDAEAADTAIGTDVTDRTGVFRFTVRLAVADAAAKRDFVFQVAAPGAADGAIKVRQTIKPSDPGDVTVPAA